MHETPGSQLRTIVSRCEGWPLHRFGVHVESPVERAIVRIFCVGMLLSVLFVQSVVGTEKGELIVTGLTPEQEAQVRASITYTANTIDFDNRPDVASQIEAETIKALEVLGYYHASARLKFIGREFSTIMQLRVEPGVPTVVSEFEFELTGPDEALHLLNRTKRELPLQHGDILNHQQYEESKNLLFNTARNHGYLESRFTKNQVLVNRDTRTASMYISMQTGPRYRLGKIGFDTSLFDQRTMERWLPFGKGAFYDAAQLHALSYQLQKSGYFSSVKVTPELAQANDGVVPVTVDVVAKPENQLSIGAGFASDTGARLRGNWLRPHHNRYGHRLELNASVSKPKQQISTYYSVPYERNPVTNHFSARVGMQNNRTDDTYAQSRSAEIGDRRRVGRGWHRDLILRWESEDFTTGSLAQQTTLLLPGISIYRTTTEGGLHPKSGSHITARLLTGGTDFHSDINLQHFSASAKVMYQFKRRHGLITRLEVGAIETNDFNRVPVSHRFFAGGHSSIRGFAFQSISPADANGSLAGGRYLTTASLEYSYQFSRNWSLAAFIDTGRAYNDSSDPFRTAIGSGIRWRSPIGPVRIDLASGLETDTVRVHLAIGPQF